MKNDSTFVSSLVTSNSTDGSQGAQMMDKKILIPLDGSQTAQTILPLLCTMAGKAGTELVLLHVIEYPCELYPVCRDDPSVDPDQLETIHKRKSVVLFDRQAYLERVATQLTRLGYNVRTEIHEGPVVAEIIKAARDLQVDFIALSTHGYSGYASPMTGSVANHVLHEARTPVMVLVHPKQDVFHIEPEMMYQAVLAGQSVDGQLI